MTGHTETAWEEREYLFPFFSILYRFGFFKDFFKNVYLAALGLNCSMRDLLSLLHHLSLQHVGSINSALTRIKSALLSPHVGSIES